MEFTNWQNHYFTAILFKIVWKIWNRPSPIKLVEEKEEVEVSKGLNPDYGAYVWLAGKRFNWKG